MAEYGDRPELSKADLAALDLVIAEMEERGIDKLTLAPEEFILTLTPGLRTLTTIMWTDLDGPWTVDRIFTEEALSAVKSGDLTLDRLIEVRNKARG